MGETVTADQIKLSIANTTTVNGKNGNQITVQNGTPHFYGQWDLRCCLTKGMLMFMIL